MAGREVPAWRANWSASMTLSPDETSMGVEPGPASASAIRAMDEPMTRAICTAVSMSIRPTATMDWNSRDRFDVHVGEDRVVVPHVEEAEGPPEPSGGLDGDVGGLGHLGLGHATLGGQHQAIDHEEVDHVVGDRPVDLLVGAAEVLEQAAHPDQRVVVRLTGAVLVVRHGHTLPGAWRCARGRRGAARAGCRSE